MISTSLDLLLVYQTKCLDNESARMTQMPTSTAAVSHIPTVRPYLSARCPRFLEECVAIAIVGLCPADQIGRRASDPIFQCWDITHSCNEDIQWQQNPCRRLSKFKPDVVFVSNMVWFGLKTRQEEYNIHLENYVVIGNSWNT